MPATISEPVRDLNQLRSRACFCWCEIAVKLNGGAHSGKDVYYDELEGRWHVFHHIDGTQSTLTNEGMSESFIAEAIRKGACIYQ